MRFKDAEKKLYELGYEKLKVSIYARQEKIAIGDTSYDAIMFVKQGRMAVRLVAPQGQTDLSLEFMVHNRNAVLKAEADEVLEHCP